MMWLLVYLMGGTVTFALLAAAIGRVHWQDGRRTETSPLPGMILLAICWPLSFSIAVIIVVVLMVADLRGALGKAGRWRK